MEQIDLTVPVPSSGGTSFWRVKRLTLDYDKDDPAKSLIAIKLVGQNSASMVIVERGQTAHDAIKALNTANLSSNSLHKRALNRFIGLGQLAGTVSGTPDS